jgi:ubiquinone/menaquinone biosynthesis C-methylase UbiE
MTAKADITSHYTKGNLLARLEKELRADGADPAKPTLEQLAPYDQFHGRGMEATTELADELNAFSSPGKDDHLLDVGSGIGGPARYFARRFGCRVTGIDLTAEFVEVARKLTARLKLEERVRFEQGDALALPFEKATFSGAYSMNVSMNIADKAALYQEIRRVLKPGAWLVLSEVAKGPGPAMSYPAPWAATAEASFLQTPEETRAGLEAAGFRVERVEDKLPQSKAYGIRVRAMLERGEKPPHRAVELIHGEQTEFMLANMAAGAKEGRIVPIEIFARAP